MVIQKYYCPRCMNKSISVVVNDNWDCVGIKIYKCETDGCEYQPEKLNGLTK